MTTIVRTRTETLVRIAGAPAHTVVRVTGVEQAGPPGRDGIGMPAGGTEGQVATKASDDDFDIVWETLLGAGLSQEQIEDLVALLLDDNSDLDWSYDDALGSLVAAIKAGAVTNTMLAGSIALAKLATDPLARANHTGTQAASTISDLAAVVKAYRLDEFAAPTAPVPFNAQRLSGLADPTQAQDAATRAWVLARIAELVAAAPGLLDTLDELAAALGDDPNFATTITTALAAKQPLDTDLTALAALVSAADRLPYATGAGTWALATFTAFARTLLAGADAAAMRSTLGLGTAALAATGDFDPAGSAAAAQAASQPLDADLTWLAANLSAFARTLVDDASAAAMRTTLELGTSAVIDEGDLALDAAQITTGTLDDARIPAAIARDAEVTAAIAAVVNGAPAGGDTLAELEARIAVVEALGSLATDAELIAAVAALIGSADAAGDTLGELQALIGLRMLKSANLSDVANVSTALTNLGFSAFVKTLIDDADAAAARGTLGLVIGTDVQAHSAVLAGTTASFTTADETKLDGIEAGATADQTAGEILAALLTVDGAGSGLDADLLDGLSSAAFETPAGAQAKADAKVAETITNGVTGIAPSQDAVFDALALKAPSANPTFTGTVTIPDGALAIADTSGLQAALDAKVPLASRKLVKKSADETVNNNTTVQDDDHLLFAVAASEVWAFRFVLFVTGGATGATADFRAAITVPSGATFMAMMEGPITSTTGITSVGRLNRLLTASGTTNGAAGVVDNATVIVTIEGVVTNGATPGDVRLQWAQGSAPTVTDVTVEADSYLEAMRVA